MLNLRDITAPLVENKAYLFSFLWPTKSFKYCIISRKFLSSDLIGGIPNLYFSYFLYFRWLLLQFCHVFEGPIYTSLETCEPFDPVAVWSLKMLKSSVMKG